MAAATSPSIALYKPAMAGLERMGTTVASTFLTHLALFAEKGAEGGGGGGNPLGLLFPFLLIGVFFYFLLIRPQRRQQARRQSMLAAVKKNDRVITAGGIYGVVTNVHAEADEVTLKVDEATNTKLRVTLSSVARVLGDEASGDTPKKA